MHLNRFSAFGIHLAISAGIALLVFLSMKLIWYPGPYFNLIDAGRLIAILLIVDMTIGPLITLVVFDLKKPELKRDLSIVAALQLAALLYGIHAVYLARPVYAVFNVDRFNVVSAADIPEPELAKVSRREFKSLPLLGPQVVGAKLPESREERQRILFSAATGGADLYQLPQYYVPYAEIHDEVRKKLKPLASLRTDPRMSKLVETFVAESGKADTGFGYVVLQARRGECLAVLDNQTLNLAGCLPAGGQGG